jgi:Divergent InlB B-repeat domain
MLFSSSPPGDPLPPWQAFFMQNRFASLTFRRRIGRHARALVLGWLSILGCTRPRSEPIIDPRAPDAAAGGPDSPAGSASTDAPSPQMPTPPAPADAVGASPAPDGRLPPGLPDAAGTSPSSDARPPTGPADATGVRPSPDGRADVGVPPTPRPVLDIQVAGHATGMVSSSDGRVVCPRSCRLELDRGTAVTLTATPPTAGTLFVGWSGACSGTGPCTVTLDADRQVTATFEPRMRQLWTTGTGRVTSLARDGRNVHALIEIEQFDNFDGTGAAPGRRDLALARFDVETGARAWVQRWPSVSSTQVSVALGGVILGSNGRLVVTGPFAFPVQFGPKLLLPQSSFDNFVFEASPDTGQVLASEQGLGGTRIRKRGSRIGLASPGTIWRYSSLSTLAPAGDFATQLFTTWDLAIDDQGGIFASGVFQGMLEFGPRSLVGATGVDEAFVLKISAADQPAWSLGFQSPVGIFSGSLALDANGDVLVAGDFIGSLTVAGQTRTSAGNRDILVAKISGSDGRLLWLRTFGGPDADVVEQLGVGLDGALYLGGVGVLAGEQPTGFLARLSPADGSRIWQVEIAGLWAFEPLTETDLLLGTSLGLTRVTVVP